MLRNGTRGLLALVVLLAGVPFTGCGERAEERHASAPVEPTDGAGGPVRGDWLVIHLLADPEHLNPLTSNDSAANAVLRWLFLSLLDPDNETLELRPLLARELPEISEDKLTYTFRLREGITFSDGEPLLADDVVFTVKAIKHPRVNAPHARNYYESVRLDDYDGLDEARKKRAGDFAKAFNEDFLRNPMGPGAFALRDPEEDYKTGERIILTHRDNYWARDDADLGDAWVDRIVLRIINDREAALVALKSGQVDLMAPTPLQYRINSKNPRFQEKIETKVHVSPGYTYLGWNQKRKIFQDPRVRRALSYFVDKRNIVDKILYGFGVPVESPIFAERPEYNRELDPYPYDPEKGKRLLAEAGWKDTNRDGILDKEIDGERADLAFEIISNSGNDIRRDVGLAVIDEFKRAGIGATFRAVDWSIMLEKVKKFEFDAVILGWGMSVMVPDSYQVWHSSQAVEGGSNHVFYRNPEVDRILEEYRVEFDPAGRKVLYDRFQEILYEEQPYTFLFMQKAITAWDRRFQGVHWYPSGSTELLEWWVPTRLQKYS
jgi:peptide/nickel transport system substrate-binding protein